MRLAAICVTLACLSPWNPAAAEELRIPPVVVAAADGRSNDGPFSERGWFAVGRLPEGEPLERHPLLLLDGLARRSDGPDPYVGEGARNELALDLAAGRRALRPAAVDEPLVVLLVGPWQNLREAWGPAEVARDGDRVTVVVEGWSDDRTMKKNVLHRTVIVLALGVMHRDRLEVVVEQRSARCESARPDLAYAPAGRTRGHVVVRPDEPAAPRCEEFAPAEPGADPESRQMPRRHARAGDRDARPGVTAGTFDLAAWLAQEDSTVPELRPAGSGDRLFAAIVGPELDSGNAATVRMVCWADRTVRILLDLWRDRGGRDKNIPWRPILVVPLDPPPALPAGDLAVEVEWRCWLAHEPGGGSREDPEERGQVEGEAEWRATLARR